MDIINLNQTLVKNIVKSSSKIFLLTANADLVKRFIKENKANKEMYVLFPYFNLETAKEIAHLTSENEYKKALSKIYQSSREINFLDAFTKNNNCTIYNVLSAYNQNIILYIDKDNIPHSLISLIPTNVKEFASLSKTKSLEVKRYINKLIKVAKYNGNYHYVNSNKENALPEAFWDRQYKIATDNMKLAKNGEKRVLIEVASQHPLLKDGSPCLEFKKRLDKAIEIYKENNSIGVPTSIGVFGSIHKYNNEVDHCSLSESGKNYLFSHGVDAKDIYAEETIIKYKGEDGVYNSLDESYVTSRVFFDNRFTDLLAVVSPYQMYRKILVYISQGLIPECIPVYTDEMFHNPIGELMFNIQDVLYIDHDGQNKQKELFNDSREERKP